MQSVGNGTVWNNRDINFTIDHNNAPNLYQYGCLAASFTITSLNPSATMEVNIAHYNSSGVILSSSSAFYDQLGEYFLASSHSGMDFGGHVEAHIVTDGRVTVEGKVSIYDKGESR